MSIVYNMTSNLTVLMVGSGTDGRVHRLATTRPSSQLEASIFHGGASPRIPCRGLTLIGA